MGKPDAVTKEYVSRCEIFADIFNQFLYDGKQVIVPEKLKERDTTEIALPFGNSSDGAVQKYRDVLKILQVMEDDHAIYVILGTELQMNIHYAMPVKDMLYNAINYAGQVSSVGRNHRREVKKALSADEYLSGFTGSDKLLPVITLTIYFGSKKWDGPTSLHQMFDQSNRFLLRFVPDYKINLMTPEHLTEEELDKFHTEFRNVMKFIKYSDNKDVLRNMINSDDSFKTVSRDTANLINVVTKSGFKIEENEEVVDMCKAIMDIREEGREQGRAEGREEGLEQGREEERISSIRNLMATLALTAKQAMDALKISPSDQQRYLKIL